MRLPKEFISCYWGKENLRLRLVKTDTLEVLKEHNTDKGIETLYQEYSNQKVINQSKFFSDYLIEQLNQLTVINKTNKAVVVASGMLSSSIGMNELGCSNLPFEASADNIFSRSFLLNRYTSLLLISGAKKGDDIMRGEEIQALGLSDYLLAQNKGILILPNAHCKHILFEEGNYKDFKTYMTGELLDNIVFKSALSDFINRTVWEDKYTAPFLEGVKKGIEEDVINKLLTSPPPNLLEQQTKEDNFYFLYGLLIGSEISYLKDSSTCINVGASGLQFKLYKLALESIIPAKKLFFFEEDLVEKALLIGQKKMLEAKV